MYLKSEETISKQAGQLAELSKRNDELCAKATELESLRDQVEESRHHADERKKSELALEKFKKRLEETGDMKKQIKVGSRIDSLGFELIRW